MPIPLSVISLLFIVIFLVFLLPSRLLFIYCLPTRFSLFSRISQGNRGAAGATENATRQVERYLWRFSHFEPAGLETRPLYKERIMVDGKSGNPRTSDVLTLLRSDLRCLHSTFFSIFRYNVLNFPKASAARSPNEKPTNIRKTKPRRSSTDAEHSF